MGGYFLVGYWSSQFNSYNYFIIPVKENTEIFSFCDEFDKNILEIPIDGEGIFNIICKFKKIISAGTVDYRRGA